MLSEHQDWCKGIKEIGKYFIEYMRLGTSQCRVFHLLGRNFGKYEHMSAVACIYVGIGIYVTFGGHRVVALGSPRQHARGS